MAAQEWYGTQYGTHTGYERSKQASDQAKLEIVLLHGVQDRALTCDYANWSTAIVTAILRLRVWPDNG